MIRKVSMILMGVVMGITATLLITADNAGDIFSKLTLGNEAKAASSETYRQLNIFGDVFERIRSQYVEKPEEQKLIKNAINGMLSSLDPHSSYLDAKEQADMRVQTKGEFGGLGIEVTMEKELVKVITPIDDTPASKAGVIAGDLITKIDGDNVRGLSLQQAVEKMRGLVNTPIIITVIRKGADKPIDITIVRAIIKIRSVRHRVEGEDVGYIRVTGFTEQTYIGLKAAIDKIRTKTGDKLKGYVIDLRLNPGGLLDQSVSVSDAFLDRGEIVSTRGRNAEEARRYNARPGDDTGGKPIIVLINGGSASASEIVAGALQDHRRATILGTRSFGKGSVQTIISLGANGALRLTTALYYTPAGKSIQGKGIVPDIIVNQPLPDRLKGRVEASGESKLRGHITGANEDDKGSGSFAYIPPDAKDDLQLIHALELIRGTKKDAAFPPDPTKGLKKKS